MKGKNGFKAPLSGKRERKLFDSHYSCENAFQLPPSQSLTVDKVPAEIAAGKYENEQTEFGWFCVWGLWVHPAFRHTKRLLCFSKPKWEQNWILYPKNSRRWGMHRRTEHGVLFLPSLWSDNIGSLSTGFVRGPSGKSGWYWRISKYVNN